MLNNAKMANFYKICVSRGGIAKIGASLRILSADRNMLISAIPPQEFRFLHFAFQARRNKNDGEPRSSNLNFPSQAY